MTMKNRPAPGSRRAVGLRLRLSASRATCPDPSLRRDG
jgi:hypothetical protein